MAQNIRGGNRGNCSAVTRQCQLTRSVCGIGDSIIATLENCSSFFNTAACDVQVFTAQCHAHEA